MRRAAHFAAAAVIVINGALAQEATRSYKLDSLLIETPWIRATPAGARVAAGYLKITNTGQNLDRLIGGSLPLATEVEVHEVTMSDGIMKMRRLGKGLEIGAGKSVELKPGGYHLMFTGLRQGLKEKQTIKGTLMFEKAGAIEVEYNIAPVGAQSGNHRSGDHIHH